MGENIVLKIRSLISDSLQHTTKNDKVIFEERDKNAKLKYLEISGLKIVVPINQDLINFPEKIFSGIDYKKTCDGVMIFEFEKAVQVLIFDVKSSTSNYQTHPTKLKCGRNFFLYLANTLKIFEDIDIIDVPCYYCVFVLKNNEKRTTSLDRGLISRNPNEPTYIYVENGEIISIRKILGIPVL